MISIDVFWILVPYSYWLTLISKTGIKYRSNEREVIVGKSDFNRDRWCCKYRHDILILQSQHRNLPSFLNFTSFTPSRQILPLSQHGHPHQPYHILTSLPPCTWSLPALNCAPNKCPSCYSPAQLQGGVTVIFVLVFFAFFLSRTVLLWTKGTKFWTYFGQTREKIEQACMKRYLTLYQEYKCSCRRSEEESTRVSKVHRQHCK
jgi:hypothetical protein